MTYSIVFLNLDGTLLDSKRQVSPATGELLRKLERQGVPIVLCSARSPAGVDLVERAVGLSSPIICYSGGLTLSAERGILDERAMPSSAAVCFKRHAAARFPEVTVSAYLYDIWLVDDPGSPAIAEEAAITRCEPLQGELAQAVHSSKVHKLLCIGPARQITALRTEGVARFPELELVQSTPNYLEVMAKDVSKQAAVRALARRLQVSQEAVVACGDYFTDLGMLEYAGLGIAMDNAPEIVKQAADRVTASNDEEGVYIALKNLRFTSV